MWEPPVPEAAGTLARGWVGGNASPVEAGVIRAAEAALAQASGAVPRCGSGDGGKGPAGPERGRPGSERERSGRPPAAGGAL